MARKSKANTSTYPDAKGGTGRGYGNQKQFEFINVHFNQTDTAYLAANWEDAGSIVFDWLTDLPESFKLSCAKDNVSGRYVATLADNDPESPTYQKILSVRGKTRASAIFGLAYADSVKYGDTAWGYGDDANESLFG